MISEVIKYGCLSLILLIGYVAYKLALKPYLIRLKYSKYENVAMRPCQSLMLGDFTYIGRDVAAGRPYYYFYRTHALTNKNKDLRVAFMGAHCVVHIISLEAHKQFNKLAPHKIDRLHTGLFAGKLASGAFSRSRSNDDFNLRRKTITSVLDLNSSSKYIPLMLKFTKERVKTWKVGDQIELLSELNYVTYNLVSCILFGGQNTDDTKYPYKKVNGEIKHLNLTDYMVELLSDLSSSYFDPKAMAFPFLRKYDLCEPFKTEMVNIRTFWECYRKFMKHTSDENSAYMRIKQTGLIEEDKVFFDLLAIIIGGFETTSRAISSTLYFGKKSTQSYQKLIKELSHFGIEQFVDNINCIQKDNINEIDYLNYFIKEALRVDGPSPLSPPYMAEDDVEICGVNIAKGTQISTDLTGIHYNPEQWHEPTKFIPERFDPNSDYFKTPGEGKTRDPFSFIPFMHGPRRCPAQTLAMLGAKTIIAYIVTSIDYELHPDIADRDDLGFGVGSKCKCLVKITKNILT